MTLREIAEALNKITKWPWKCMREDIDKCGSAKGTSRRVVRSDYNLIATISRPQSGKRDSEFIAAAPEYIAFLLNSVVEERAKVIQNRTAFDSNNVTENDWCILALHELNLKGAWPGKEGE